MEHERGYIKACDWYSITFTLVQRTITVHTFYSDLGCWRLACLYQGDMMENARVREQIYGKDVAYHGLQTLWNSATG